MVPRVTTPGRSFAGAGMYYLHDKDALSAKRVEFTHVENIPTNDPEGALRWMAFSSIAANEEKQRNRTPGRRIEKSVWTVSLAWHPEQQPTREEMIGAGRSWLSNRGLHGHQALMVAHNDEQYRHIHLIVNLVHPVTLKLNRAAVSHAKRKSSEWAEAYERREGKIYCERRVENNARRKKGEFVRHREPEAEFRARISQLYQSSQDGKAFKAALAEYGYTLAQGRRLVVIDREGKVHSLSRQIDNASAKEIAAKLADVKLPNLKEGRSESTGGQEGRKNQKRGAQPEIADREAQEREQDQRLSDAAIQHEKEIVRTGLLNRLQDRQHDELGAFFSLNDRRRQELAGRFETQYGPDERRLRKGIEALEAELKGATAAKKWLMNRSGQLNELDNMRLSLQSIEQRKTESTNALENDITARRAQLEERHVLERQHVSDRDFTPHELDPLARSIEQQQAAQSAEFLGAAAPAEGVMNTGDAPASDGGEADGTSSTSHSESHMERDHGGPSLGHGSGE